MERHDQQPQPATPGRLSRRTLLRGTGLAVTGAASSLLFGCGGDSKPASSSKDEPPPEVTTIRLPKSPAACQAPLLLARDFLLEEGFTDVQYFPTELSVITDYIVDGRLDLSFDFTPLLTFDVDQGRPLVMLAGANVACFQVIAAESIRSFADLRGKRVATLDRDPHPADYAFITSILQYVGLVAGRDVELVRLPANLRINPFNSGAIDAVYATAPQSLSIRDTSNGRVILDSMVDKPWSQYVCCQVVTRRQFLKDHPVATRRALRAILRGVDVCAREPERAARALVDNGWVNIYAYALESMKTIAFDAWRSYNPEDTIRFYSLRLKEAGVIKSTPEEIISRGTDFRFFNELKRELAFLPGAGPLRAAAQFNCDIEDVPASVAGPRAERS